MDLDRHPEARATEGVLVVKADAPIFYANAQSVRDSIDDLVGTATDPVRVVVLDLDTNDDIDVTTADQLVKLRHSLEGRGIDLALTHVHAPTLLVAQRAGLVRAADANHLFASVSAAVAWASDGQHRGADGSARGSEVGGTADA